MAECPTCGSTVVTRQEEAEREAEMDTAKRLLDSLASDWRRSADNALERKIEGVGYVTVVVHAYFKQPLDIDGGEHG